MATYYANLELNNTSGTTEIPMTFEHTLTYGLNFIPSDYVVCLMRFKLPNYGNPIFHFVDGSLTMSMSWKTNSVTEPVVWIPWSAVTTGRSCYYIDHLIYMLNSCLKTSWTALNTLVALPTTDIPYFQYDVVNELISLVAHKSYYLTDDLTSPLTDPIYIYENTLMNRILEGMPVYSTKVVGTEFRFKVLDLHNNTINSNYLEMKQEASSFNQICDQARILFYSDIPTVSEVVGVSGGSNSQTAGLKVLADFQPDNYTLTTFHADLMYNAITPYRTVQMTSQEQLRTIRVNCAYTDNLGAIYQLYCPPNGFASIKLLFIPKNMAVNIKNWTEQMKNATRI